MANYYATPIFPLARGKVRYVGEPVMGVIAESRYQAEDALELIAVDYEPLPVVIDSETAVADGAPLLHEEARTNVLVSREFKRGDVDAAMDAAPDGTGFFIAAACGCRCVPASGGCSCGVHAPSATVPHAPSATRNAPLRSDVRIGRLSCRGVSIIRRF